MNALSCQQDFASALGVEPGASESVAVFKVQTEEDLDTVCQWVDLTNL